MNENKLKIPEGTIILCASEKLVKELFDIFTKLGLTWSTGDAYDPNDSNWHIYKSLTYYRPHEGLFGAINGHSTWENIITAEEFIKLHNMESRNITLTLEKAKEWYNSGSADLREVALQAYTKDELEIPEWQNIKTFEDACRALRIYDRSVSLHLGGSTDTAYYHHMDAVSKLDIIRKALNGDWKPSLVQGNVYYPYVRFYPAGQKAREAVSEHKEWKLSESFIADGKKYTIIGGDYYCHYTYGGLTTFSHMWGAVLPSLGLLGCKSKEIAEHMSRYFSKEIFEATYAHHVDTYQWV